MEINVRFTFRPLCLRVKNRSNVCGLSGYGRRSVEFIRIFLNGERTPLCGQTLLTKTCTELKKLIACYNNFVILVDYSSIAQHLAAHTDHFMHYTIAKQSNSD
jgi:hypothetical protein